MPSHISPRHHFQSKAYGPFLIFPIPLHNFGIPLSRVEPHPFLSTRELRVPLLHPHSYAVSPALFCSSTGPDQLARPSHRVYLPREEKPADAMACTQPSDTSWTPMQLAAMRIYAERCRMRRTQSLPPEPLASPLSTPESQAADGHVSVRHTISRNEETPWMRDMRDKLGLGKILQSDSGVGGARKYTADDEANLAEDKEPEKDIPEDDRRLPYPLRASLLPRGTSNTT